MRSQAVNILGSILAVSTLVLINGRVASHVTVEHRLVNTLIITVFTFERLVSNMIALMILQMMLVGRNKLAGGTF